MWRASLLAGLWLARGMAAVPAAPPTDAAPGIAFSHLEARLAARSQTGNATTNPAGFTDYSPEGFAASMAYQRGILAELHAIDRAALPHAAQVTYDAIEWDAERILDRETAPWLQFPYTPYEFLFHGPNRVLTDFRFRADQDVRAYLALTSQYPAALDSMVRFIEAQMRQGIYVQRDVAASLRRQFAALATAPAESFAYPGAARIAALSPAARQRLQRDLQSLIAGRINPALRRLSDRFDETYQAAAPRRYGMAQYPGGKAYYKVLMRYWLTLDLTPEEAFRRSQDALDRIESDLQELRAEMGVAGNRRDFEERLAHDPAFIAKTPADVEKTYLGYMARIDPLLPRLFCRAAPYGYGVQRASPAAEAALTFGFAGVQTEPERRGMYYYNGSNLGQRSLLPAQALIYHELAPGHYWQEAMAFTSAQLTAYPRRSNAYSESWGDFAQLLAYEQGVFRTPQEKYGRRLFNAMFHARALADIGVNYFGYDFEWGLAVLRRYTFESDLQNRSSLSRDTTDWPAQILPYSFGSEALLRLREKARGALGERFSAPRFYDAVLSVGAVALPVLERQVDWFIENEKNGSAPGICVADGRRHESDR